MALEKNNPLAGPEGEKAIFSDIKEGILVTPQRAVKSNGTVYFIANLASLESRRLPPDRKAATVIGFFSLILLVIFALFGFTGGMIVGSLGLAGSISWGIMAKGRFEIWFITARGKDLFYTTRNKEYHRKLMNAVSIALARGDGQ